MAEWFVVFFSFFFPDDAAAASSLRRATGHSEATRGVLGHSPGEPGTEFSHYGASPEAD